MKKILTLLVLGLAGLFLVGCQDSKEVVEVTALEAQKMMSEVDSTVVLDDVVALDMEMDFSYTMNTTQDSVVINSTNMDVSGSISLIADVKSYEEFYLKARLDLVIRSELSDMEIDFGLGNMEIKGDFYIIEGNAYLDGQLKVSGITTTVQNKATGFLTEELYETFKTSITTGTFNPQSLITIEENDNFTMYQIGNSYELVLEMSKEAIIEWISEFSDDSQMNITLDNEDYLNVIVNFGETFERFRFDADLNGSFDYLETYFNQEISGTFSLTANINFNLHAQLPKNLPTQTDFDGFIEGGIFTNFGLPGSPAPKE
ncbi:MAG: hypothetical protein PHD47_03165 [Acholeplasmataceae bacterium]|nr:hypothetical protein [Acholeplasmataceae bacterium]